MKYLLCCFFGVLLLMASNCRAQAVGVADADEPQTTKSLTMAGLNYLGGFVAQERRVAGRLAVTYGIGMHYSFFDNSANPPIFGTRFINVLDKNFGYPYTTQGATPYLLVEVRSYNLARRVFRGRSIRANAANYIALVGEVPLAGGALIKVPNLALAYPVGLKYGLRRTLSQHIYAEGSLGGYLKISSSQAALQPRVDAALSWYW